ncbi:biopolymer transporter ExbD [Novosphingobium marinum]|uniref:Biopolymer transport protein TolR n=1 Tax=Novosphingobium marinum TaxID=1514948 RepID=A0A7Z0BV83_9SPHN|nr:ExbD/TolR family protein [Novosphingobium marinum]NYH95988.1 biopolymer transport protein TolR [Novosphingobium marinum]GGC31588.1 biopolymer transporter ExbD [Novosphingobium marinum]
MAMGLAGGRGGTRRKGRGGRAPMAEINVTPFVDVMLVLLIIFMVTAPLLTAGVPVELPESRAKALAEEARQITISMSRDGAVYLDDEQLAPGELPERLADIPTGGDGRPPLVTLRADTALDYGRVMGVMGELNRAGFNSISLVTSASAGVPGVSDGSGASE